jgi:hypothetical protein
MFNGAGKMSQREIEFIAPSFALCESFYRECEKGRSNRREIMVGPPGLEPGTNGL